MVPKNQSTYLKLLQSILLSQHQDAIFVFVDLEGGRSRKDAEYKIYEIGISMLDTRHILNCEASDAITHHFVVDVITEALSMVDTETSSSPLPQQHKLSNIVLIGHGIHTDTKLLLSAGLDITHLPTVIKTLDTQTLSKPILGKNYSLSLLLQALKIPHKNLHSAANDANFTLKAFIMLVHRSVREFPSPGFEIMVFRTVEGRKLAWLQAVAREDEPDVEERNEGLRRVGGNVLDGVDGVGIGCIFGSKKEDDKEDLVKKLVFCEKNGGSAGLARFGFVKGLKIDILILASLPPSTFLS
ncbi:hypothetical protein DL98DRAFT_587677 [Cadophora sp. DSE1049]|nr:hypothetical protein DL98DRAFT_587677 [Cadophora sp. DSE1049]